MQDSRTAGNRLTLCPRSCASRNGLRFVLLHAHEDDATSGGPVEREARHAMTRVALQPDRAGAPSRKRIAIHGLDADVRPADGMDQQPAGPCFDRVGDVQFITAVSSGKRLQPRRRRRDADPLEHLRRRFIPDRRYTKLITTGCGLAELQQRHRRATRHHDEAIIGGGDDIRLSDGFRRPIRQ